MVQRWALGYHSQQWRMRPVTFSGELATPHYTFTRNGGDGAGVAQDPPRFQGFMQICARVRIVIYLVPSLYVSQMHVAGAHRAANATRASSVQRAPPN